MVTDNLMSLALWSEGAITYETLKKIPPREVKVISDSITKYREQMAKMEAAKFGAKI